MLLPPLHGPIHIAQGLGFAAGAGSGFDSLPDKTKRLQQSQEEDGAADAGPLSMRSLFVRAGEATQRQLTAAEAATLARREAEHSAAARRSTADAVARRLAEKAAEIKRQRQQER